MLQPSEKPSHPGAFIRKRVIPPGMSVTEAAKRLSVGRPALSNLLNGKSSLSPGMAAKLEKAFGADSRGLLDHQAAFDRHRRSGDARAVTVRAYVPGFLTIEARQIHDWAEDNRARHLLPVLLRKLVHSTGDDLRQVDFPSYDNAERRGWDGWIEAEAATPWIPEGKSGWEFGVSQDPRCKAEHDHSARLKSVSPIERADYTFVFVTPRNWPGKTKWARDKQEAGGWKDVRAFDASDLEQWLEQSIPAQIWLAEQLRGPIDGFETLDQCWRRWADVREPMMTSAMFQPSITAYRDTFGKWLEGPSERPFLVAADSRDEALAFLRCLFQEDGIADRWRDLPAVFGSPEALRKLAASTAPFLPIVHTDAAERELAAVCRQRHCIAVRPSNAVDSEPDIALDLLNQDAFEKALADMDIKGDEVERLARESGRSPTILRRRLSNIPAIRTPEWARNDGNARGLVPMALIGTWHDKSNADREVLSSFWGSEGYERIEENIARLLQLDDAPVWSIGQYRGVASKVDALFAIGGYITGRDLKDFFWLAEHVLSETDPALELPEDRRWAAGWYGKVRDHSAALRKGICETLVILSVHGNDLFRERIGIDVEGCVSSLVRRLLTPLTLDKLLSHDRDLPSYAEAAPGEFLELIEEDLRQPQPVVLGLLKPAESGMFGTCLRSGLLWALECLAWKRLGRVTAILARLSRTAINDNWDNKPINSLAAIYRSWMPQTAASLGERMQSLETLTKEFRDIGWQICMGQLDSGPQMGFHSHRPRWRSDASGVGQVTTNGEIHEFCRKALDFALAWPRYDEKTLGDLVERVHAIPDEDQVKVWNLIDEWAESEIDDKAKASLRERIQRSALSHWSQRRDLTENTKERALMAYEKLQPEDPVVQHTWLFVNHWIPFLADDEEGYLDHEKHSARIHQLRIAAIEEIWKKRGFEGVEALLSDGGIPEVTGGFLALSVVDTRARVDFLRECLSVVGDMEGKMDGCIKGFLRSLCDEDRRIVLSATLKDVDTDRIVRLLRCAPFGQDTWCLLGQYDGEIHDRYWREVVPGNLQSESELNEIVDRLLDAKRPHSAFDVVGLAWSEIETGRLKRLLMACATEDAEPVGHLSPYFISTALESLDGRAGVTRDEMARFEFVFLKALSHEKRGTPNLERYIAEDPIAFVQVLAFTFRRNDGGEDPSGWRVEDPERRDGLASTAYRLLDRISHIPGTGTDGEIHTEELYAWVAEVRRLCTEYGRAEIGDNYIGQLLSRVPAKEENVWPPPSICEAMERIASSQIRQGFNIGVRNGRGAKLRAMGVGGTQERYLASKYRRWAEQHANDYPYVSSILEGIASDYDRQAACEDDRGNVDKRLWH